jgi:ribosomal protein L37AE/L43A
VIAFPATASPQKKVKTAKKPRKPAEVPNKDVDVTALMWDKPCCPQCGECENIATDRKPIFKPGEQGEADIYSQRWKCKKCDRTWTRKAVVAETLPQKSHGTEQSWDSRVESFLAEVAPSD